MTKRSRQFRWVFVLVLVFCPAVLGQTDIRKVDFKNFTYKAYCAGEAPENVTVKNGEFLKETPMDGYVDRFYFNIYSVNYGDLTGDGRDEAIVLTVCNTGGTGNFSEGFIYTFEAGKPKLFSRIAGGDRAYGGLRSASIANGILTIESNDPGELGASCCPESIITNQYRLRGGKLIAAAKSVTRPIYPTERVSFARGTSAKTLAIRIAPDEGKRFVVGARAGQQLFASIDSGKGSLRILEDVEASFATNSVTARLPKSGDYTVEVRNDSDGEMEFTLNIRIK
ncbi:MAG: hypothetical protein ABI539_05425 [Acidobacteriota bacterium]